MVVTVSLKGNFFVRVSVLTELDARYLLKKEKRITVESLKTQD
jgi:hypothetical protein